MKGNLFIISAPSGGGKGTLIREVLKTLPKVGYSVSFTTRQPREGEKHGREYFFVSKEDFDNHAANGEFLEFAEVHGRYYGTSKNQVEKMTSEGFDVILEIDVQGAAQVREILPEAVSIFIMPPSFETLRQRLQKRGTETPENFALRLHNAFEEMSRFEEFDYIVINNDLSQAIEQFKAIFLAERARLKRQTAFIKSILQSFKTEE
jgi:guanylate kinase